MNKVSLLLLASLASTGAYAAKNDAPVTQFSNSSNVFEVNVAEAGINNSLSDSGTDQAAIYEYAERVFTTLSTDIEEAFLASLDKQFAIRLSSR